MIKEHTTKEGAILFKRDSESKKLDNLIKKIEALEKRIAKLEKKK